MYIDSESPMIPARYVRDTEPAYYVNKIYIILNIIILAFFAITMFCIIITIILKLLKKESADKALFITKMLSIMTFIVFIFKSATPSYVVLSKIHVQEWFITFTSILIVILISLWIIINKFRDKSFKNLYIALAVYTVLTTVFLIIEYEFYISIPIYINSFTLVTITLLIIFNKLKKKSCKWLYVAFLTSFILEIMLIDVYFNPGTYEPTSSIWEILSRIFSRINIFSLINK